MQLDQVQEILKVLKGLGGVQHTRGDAGRFAQPAMGEYAPPSIYQPEPEFDGNLIQYTQGLTDRVKKANLEANKLAQPSLNDNPWATTVNPINSSILQAIKSYGIED